MKRRSSRPSANVESLLNRLEWAFERRLPMRDLTALARDLIREARPGSAEARVGKLRLAQASIAREPWRAARLAWELTRESARGEDWGTLGLAYTKLGHFKAAARAYRRALGIEPCPVCHHNLGHLLHMALGRPDLGLSHLERAYQELPHEPEVASSLAHALFATGHASRARRILATGLGDEAHADAVLDSWSALEPRPPETTRPRRA